MKRIFIAFLGFCLTAAQADTFCQTKPSTGQCDYSKPKIVIKDNRIYQTRTSIGTIDYSAKSWVIENGYIYEANGLGQAKAGNGTLKLDGSTAYRTSPNHTGKNWRFDKDKIYEINDIGQPANNGITFKLD